MDTNSWGICAVSFHHLVRFHNICFVFVFDIGVIVRYVWDPVILGIMQVTELDPYNLSSRDQSNRVRIRYLITSA